jgi:hypothetical protein
VSNKTKWGGSASFQVAQDYEIGENVAERSSGQKG